MRNFLTLLPRSSELFSYKTQSRSLNLLALFLITLSLALGWNRTQAQTPATTTTPTQQAPANAPKQLQDLLTQIDAAANQHNINAVMQFYSQNFTHSDGLNLQSMQQALTQLWQQYPQLRYQTQLQSWQPQGNAIIAETVTNVSGSQAQPTGKMVFNATIRSRQRIENGKIVRQDILSERSQLKAGDNPPTVELKLPQQVKAGQQYSFDAIVQEPLGEDYLLGAAIEEAVTAQNYLNPTKVDLELLPAGGVFKVGTAPAKPEDRWISAVLIRGNGMTLVSQRLNVVGSNPPATQKPAANSQ